MTSPEKQDLKTKICCACGKDKPITSFYRNKIMKDGYEGKCKYCKKTNVKCRSGDRKKPGRPKLKNTPQLWNVRKEDWIETFEFLKKIGYSLERNIHEQFCERHNLVPRKRMYEKSIQYSPGDLGMI